MVELHRETRTIPSSPVVTSNSLSKPVPYSPNELFKRVTLSSSLFFIQYIPEGSIRPRWFLVQIELYLTYSLDLQPETTGHYLVVFLARHPRDKQLTDDFAR